MKKRSSLTVLLILFLFSCLSVRGAKKNPFARPTFLINQNEKEQKKSNNDPSLILSNLHLTGIINGQIAIINHQFCEKGDKVGGLVVKDVLSNKVVLEGHGRTFDLILNISKIKKE